MGKISDEEFIADITGERKTKHKDCKRDILFTQDRNTLIGCESCLSKQIKKFNKNHKGTVVVDEAAIIRHGGPLTKHFKKIIHTMEKQEPLMRYFLVTKVEGRELINKRIEIDKFQYQKFVSQGDDWE